MKKVAVIMGSDSDLPVVEKAIEVLKQFEVPYTVRVLSAPRTPAEAKKIGSDYIVVGRPITAAEDPVLAYERCCREFIG